MTIDMKTFDVALDVVVSALIDAGIQTTHSAVRKAFSDGLVILGVEHPGYRPKRNSPASAVEPDPLDARVAALEKEVSAIIGSQREPIDCDMCHNTGAVSTAIPNGIAFKSASCPKCGRSQVAMNESATMRFTDDGDRIWSDHPLAAPPRDDGPGEDDEEHWMAVGEAMRHEWKDGTGAGSPQTRAGRAAVAKAVELGLVNEARGYTEVQS